MRWMPVASWHGPMQMVFDLLLVTCLIYLTGTQDSYFIWLYPLAIIVASILFSREATFIVAGLSFVLLGGLTELIYYNILPRMQVEVPSSRQLQTWIFSNLFYFLAVAYLSSLLAQSLRRQGAELEVKRGELQDLQAFNEDIIHSMRGGLLTTDLEGHILLLNRTGEEITGYKFRDVRGALLQDLWPVFWLPGEATADGKLPQRQEIEFLTPEGQQRFIGISASPLRTGERRTTGYVFNFQDLTSLKLLEQEVATKERMAALGRLSAAIAHEIRQPLTAMAGAVKELGRLVPLQEDEQHLVGIVSRESERLNRIITEFLNYSREKTYDFSEEDVSSLLDETLTLLERNPQVDEQVPHRTHIHRLGSARARGPQPHQAGVLESCRTTRCAPCPMAAFCPSRSKWSRSGCASASAIPARASIPSTPRKFSSRCNRISRAAPAWAWPSCTRSCRRTAGALPWFPKRTRARSLPWNCRAWRDGFGGQASACRF